MGKPLVLPSETLYINVMFSKVVQVVKHHHINKEYQRLVGNVMLNKADNVDAAQKGQLIFQKLRKKKHEFEEST